MLGVTSSERYLALLAKKTFLSLWSYSNVFRHQSHSDQNNIEGKELCDLLVVFENNIIIFSDKDCKFNEEVEIGLAWNRWYKKSVKDSIKQIYGAERWIKDFPDQIYLDHGCQKAFPVPIPNSENARIYRIAITRSISDHCKKFFEGSSGSLIFTNIKDELNDDMQDFKPFHISGKDNTKGHVHVFDDVALDIVLGELDTISDFVDYLRAKEELIDNRTVFSSGEEEILANYLASGMLSGVRRLELGEPKHAHIFLEGMWKMYATSPQRLKKRKADDVSYIWDRLIEEFSRHAIDETQYLSTTPGITGTEPAIRVLARLNRYERRNLSEALEDFIKTYRLTTRMKVARVVMPQNGRNIAYIFLFLTKLEGKTYESYRKVRIKMLEMYCNGIKVHYPELKAVVGLGFDSDWRGIGSEDLMYVDVSDWNPENNKDLLSVMEEVDIFQGNIKPRATRFSTAEYPRKHEKISVKGRNINKPCPCGSGIKYKKCCMVKH